MTASGRDRFTYRVAITNQKGGVGKTTTAISLAAALAQQGYPVLMLDLDPQGNASTGLGIGQNRRMFSTYDLIFGNDYAGSAIHPMQNLSVIPSAPELLGAEIELVDQADRETALARGLRAWIADGAAPNVIIFDCPPSLGLLTINALCAADVVLVPLQCEFYALEGLASLLKTLERVRRRLNPALQLEGVLLTMFDRRNNLSELVAADVRGFLGKKVFNTVIPRNVRLSEAPSHGLPITVYDPKSPGALAYINFALELMARRDIGWTAAR